MKESIHRNYLRDLGVILSEMAIEARRDRETALGTEREDYQIGYLAGFHRVISLMQQQSDGFQISLKDIGLDKIDADRDLL